jgi:hypothetical protein
MPLSTGTLQAEIDAISAAILSVVTTGKWIARDGTSVTREGLAALIDGRRQLQDELDAQTYSPLTRGRVS